MIWATFSSQSCFCWLYRNSPFGCKEYNQSGFGIDHLVISMCRVFSCVVGKGYLLGPMCSPDKTVSLCPASFCTPRPNLLVTPGTSWFPTFAFQYPMRKRTSLLVLVLEGLVGPQNHSTSVSSNEWLGNRLGLLWYSMVCLVDEQRSFCHFLDYTQVLHFGFFVDYEDSISSKEFLPTVVDIRVIWIKFTHSNPF